MSDPNSFSDVTLRYLNCYQEILAEMICGMTSAKPTQSISHTFIIQMIPHHMAAIEMSENLLKYTTCIPLQKIAQDIVTEQTKSIQDMRCADPVCRNFCQPAQAVRSYLYRYKNITETMFAEMKDAAPSNNINVSFMREMIPHHMGAVRMSENALSYRICPNLNPILLSIISSQKKGIQQMESLLCEISSEGC